MPKIDPSEVPVSTGSSYPPPFDAPCRERRTWRLGRAGGLTQFGVNLVELAPGAWSSQRHYHMREDEFVYVLEGEVVLVEDEGETVLRAGDAAAFPAGTKNGHHLQNRSGAPARVLVVGTRDDEDEGAYPDIDMIYTKGRYSAKDKRAIFRHRDGTPYT